MKSLIVAILSTVFSISTIAAQYNPYLDKSIFTEKRQQFMEKIG